MATVLVGYAALFSELGLGTAIIQRQNINENELSSTFWFTICFGLFLALICFLLAYPTVFLFKEPRILHITQFAATIYLLGALLIVPQNILMREVRFKELGFIHFLSSVLSCTSMIFMAVFGFGVWTLIGGHFVRKLTQTISVFFIVSWRPKFHFNFKDVKPYLKFGLNVAGSRSLRYIYTKSDRFFGGRFLGAQPLGYYSLALQLASIPTDRMVSLIQQVSFPVFSKYQDDIHKYKDFYLKITKFIAMITFPIFIGVFFLAKEIVTIILGTKWMPMIFPLRILCMAQLIVSITTVNNLANNAQGRPHWGLYFNIFNTTFLPVSFYFTCKHGINVLVLPWITVFPLICVGWTWVTLSKIDISLYDYLKNLLHPLGASIFMLVALLTIQYTFRNLGFLSSASLKSLIFLILTGAICYLGYLVMFEKENLLAIWKLRKT